MPSDGYIQYNKSLSSVTIILILAIISMEHCAVYTDVSIPFKSFVQLAAMSRQDHNGCVALQANTKCQSTQ